MANYKLLAKQVEELTADAPTKIAALANTSALLWENMEDLNWLGFYIADGKDMLQLGPFQGKVACYSIAYGKGVCGTAAATQKIQRIANVHEFAGHIACDSASNSEIVLPLIHKGKLFAVLDIDSPKLARFSAEDEEGLSLVAKALMHSLYS